MVATLAKQAPTMSFTTLAHHIDLDWLREAYRLTRKDGAVGVDGQTAEAYGANMEVNLQSLLDRSKSGAYKAPPVRRVHIPKGKGAETRPIGIPTFEDKILQRAVTMVLESIYEQDFLDCSYGFRPGRSPHQALQAFREQMMAMRGGWVLELDIRKFFDNLDHAHLREMLSLRIRDGVLNHRINQWCRKYRHRSLADQHKALCLKLQGHYAYYGLTGNYAALRCFWQGVQQSWKKWLSRRSQRAYLDWPRFGRLLERYPLPPPVVVHSVYRSVAKR